MKTLVLLLALASAALAAEAPLVLVVGDSLTEGYGLDPEEAYPAVMEKLFKEQGRTVRVVNGGISGSTTANATQRVRWFLKAKPKVVVLALGANDGLRGLKTEESRKNLESAIKLARENGVQVLLAAMKLPTNYGAAYRASFEQMYQRLAKEQRIPLLPFLLEGVGGVPAMNQPDGIHPNQAGHKKIAENMVRALGPHL